MSVQNAIPEASHLSESAKFSKETSHMTESMLCCQQCFGQMLFSATGGRHERRRERCELTERSLFLPVAALMSLCDIQEEELLHHTPVSKTVFLYFSNMFRTQTPGCKKFS